MSPEVLAGGVAAIALMAYAVFGGADFGGGIWTLLATGERKEAQRNALEKAIGPVWETNHVWLILVVVTLFVVFPTGYAAIFTALYVPFFLALIGISARGAAFAFRHYGDRESQFSVQSLRFFSVASIITPFIFGLIVGGVSGGHVDVDGRNVLTGAWTGWLGPFALMCGLIGLTLCAFVAAAFMVPRTEGELQRDFRWRAVAASLALGLTTTVAIPVARWDAPDFGSRLADGDLAAMMGVVAALGLLTLVALAGGVTRGIPVLAGMTAGGVVLTWALAQHPFLLMEALTLEEAAAERIMVVSFLVALPAGALILVPSLWFLYWTFSRDVFVPDEAPPGGH